MKYLKLFDKLIFNILVVFSFTYGEPRIILNGNMDLWFDISKNINHTYRGSRPYGVWIDGPMNPYRFANNTYFQIPHSENFRIKVPNHYWGESCKLAT